jgi:AcrR family transcriptional regulator
VKRANQTREKIRDVAQKLIAEHGVDGISIRDIVTAAGQRNMASLYYYFRNKDELIKELVRDAWELMESARAEHLGRLEEIGEPLTVRQIAHVMVSGAKFDPVEGGRNDTIMRFMGAVNQTHRHLLVDVIGGEHRKTYDKCQALLRKRLTHIPPPVLNQRLLFFNIAFSNFLVAREEAMAAGGRAGEYWSHPGTYANMLDFLCGGLQAPCTISELAAGAEADALQTRHFAEAVYGGAADRAAG